MKLITSDLINELISRAGSNPRQRINHNVHESLTDPVQKLFMACRLETYFRPHRHPEKWEFAVAIRGLFHVLVFDDTGCVLERVSIGPDADVIAFEMPPDTWHSWVTMIDGSVFFEAKEGPYTPLRRADVAEWSPEEGTPQVTGFLPRLRGAKVGDRVT